MWDDAPIVTLDLTDPNIWHFMGELMLPTFHALLNLDLMPRHVARCAFVLSVCSNCTFAFSSQGAECCTKTRWQHNVVHGGMLSPAPDELVMLCLQRFGVPGLARRARSESLPPRHVSEQAC